MKGRIMGMMGTTLALLWLLPAGALAQTPEPAPDDVASIDGIIAAVYGAISGPAGQPRDWDRFRSLHLPEATLISNPEQRGSFDVLGVEDFIDWIDRATGPIIGTSQDLGFSEDEIHNVVNRYGDIANVFSTYEKHFYGETQNLGRGINTFNVVFHEGRWWIVSIVWDEESGAGPIPDRYLP